MNKSSVSKKKTAKKKVAKKKQAIKTNRQALITTESEIVAPLDPTIAMIHVIERAAVNPDVDIDKMERLMNMQERMMDRNAEAEFNQAMTRVQANLPTIPKDAYNEHTKSKYSKHETIVRIIKPIYTKEGFAISFSEQEQPELNQNKKASERNITIIGVLRHKGGHSEKYQTTLPIDMVGISGNANKTGVHGTGSTITYGRRYLTCMIFDVATGDDTDGNVEAVEPVPCITENQVNALDAKIRENNISMKGVLSWMNKEMKVKSLEKIPAKYHDYVDQKIDQVIKQKSA